MNGSMAARYDRVDNTTKDDTKALNAVGDPTLMQPRSVVIQPQSIVELRGFLCLSEILANVLENGVASSRARVQNVLPAVMYVPMQVHNTGSRMISSRPNAPAWLEVAW